MTLPWEELRLHLRKYTDTYYDALPDGSFMVAVIDRRPPPPPPSKKKPRKLSDIPRRAKDGGGPYGGPPYFMRAYEGTRRWEWLEDEDEPLKEAMLAKIAAGRLASEAHFVVSPYDGRRNLVPSWVRGEAQ